MQTAHWSIDRLTVPEQPLEEAELRGEDDRQHREARRR